MKEDWIEEGRFSRHGEGLGTVTEAMVRQRAEELAVINGRSKHHVLDSDLDQARRELTGRQRLVPEPTAADIVPETERWEAVPDNSGHRVPSVPAPDEQTFAEQLVEEGIDDAEQDQMIKATRADLEREGGR